MLYYTPPVHSSSSRPVDLFIRRAMDFSTDVIRARVRWYPIMKENACNDTRTRILYFIRQRPPRCTRTCVHAHHAGLNRPMNNDGREEKRRRMVPDGPRK